MKRSVELYLRWGNLPGRTKPTRTRVHPRRTRGPTMEPTSTHAYTEQVSSDYRDLDTEPDGPGPGCTGRAPDTHRSRTCDGISTTPNNLGQRLRVRAPRGTEEPCTSDGCESLLRNSPGGPEKGRGRREDPGGPVFRGKGPSSCPTPICPTLPDTRRRLRVQPPRSGSYSDPDRLLGVSPRSSWGVSEIEGPGPPRPLGAPEARRPGRGEWRGREGRRPIGTAPGSGRSGTWS